MSAALSLLDDVLTFLAFLRARDLRPRVPPVRLVAVLGTIVTHHREHGLSVLIRLSVSESVERLVCPMPCVVLWPVPQKVA